MEAIRRKVVLLKSQRQSKTQPAIGLDLESMWNSPSLRGMLSFLEVSPEERRQMLELRQARDAQSGYPALESSQANAEEQKNESDLQATPVSAAFPTGGAECVSCNAREQDSGSPEEVQSQVTSTTTVGVMDISGLKIDLRTAGSSESFESPGSEMDELPGQPMILNSFHNANRAGEPFSTSTLPSAVQQESQGTSEEGTLIRSVSELLQPIRIDSDTDSDLWSLAELGRVATPYELRPMVLAQDAHTPGEELLYGKMWSRARPVEGKSFRILTIGIKRLTAMVGLSKTDNCKNNVQGLVRKLAIDDLGVAPNPNHGHVYRVWDQSAILQRRRERGLTHYFRLRRAVVLTNPNSAEIAASAQIVEQSKRGTSFLLQGNLIAAHLTRNPGSVQTESKFEIGNSNETPHCVPAPQSVVQTLLDVMGDCDDDSANRIVAAAKNGRPAIPEPVIVQIIQMKGPRIRKNANIAYPLRVLENAVFETASGVTGANLCKAWEQAEKVREENERRRKLGPVLN
jgi:hypothetical protein